MIDESLGYWRVDDWFKGVALASVAMDGGRERDWGGFEARGCLLTWHRRLDDQVVGL